MRKTKDYVITYSDGYLNHVWDTIVTAPNKAAARSIWRRELHGWAKFNEYPFPAKIARLSKVLEIAEMDDVYN
jgi:hypothetical protein